ncbi:3-phosphoshikimate 1-carboxyvinyltransferase [Endomicrobiia bacterium]|uniref:3-phosphoshikimate 1-carboxyvinyltransferase n=1 Tax=Endomicrobium trichonymphae TaxID=1408204 RepID=UPI0008652D88|nr:3-phosphoshikimate 1-carboxyvinyltransferase [Candidatus Endomicrobium trichonymphae]BAV59204.1 3-phosphoshikimate 1-carboxyvinyltransferase [Candidatus Endomicrobium trichonymphae]GHT09877.1 3-phosphoshikimate 1-carboxyvinyltransferase [Endomicrobiia bacterium]GHT16139.1 3-phosphoshikimate 1-carboxyvinyltransferase [Endomicrobiia bacterium]GMO55357.1 MAG: 3-phosphoshikimate 1-carboxyvinyltransferase [Candidatus Endomicrobium trichonymphae]
MEIKLKKTNYVSGVIEVPSDKSITHRAVMLSSLAEGNSIVRDYLPSDDCNRTIEAFRQMGVEIKIDNGSLYIKGAGLKLAKPQNGKYNIYAGNSGTTTRLLSGILAGQDFETVITGDDSLSKRPMRRVILPLSQMGANIKSNDGLLPLIIKGRNPLKELNYESDKSTAQVKSAILFAGLFAAGATTYKEPVKSRDHSERMLKAFGVNITVNGNFVTVYPAEKLIAQDITVPGDISSAAFFIAAALIVPDSNLTIRNVGVNPTRDGLIEVLKQMGADITLANMREISQEPVCDIVVKYSKLKAADIDASLVPRMVDEIPVFVLIATQADGITRISGAKELRVKESDRIESVTSQFKKLGAQIESLEDGFIINGNSKFNLAGTIVDSFDDHRIAMTLAIASLIAEGETIIRDSHCVDISFPGFYKVLNNICR